LAEEMPVDGNFREQPPDEQSRRRAGVFRQILTGLAWELTPKSR